MKKIVQSVLYSVFALLIIASCSKDDEPVVVAPAKFTIDLTTKNFGDIEVEKTASQTFKIPNKGGQNLELKSFTLTGTNKAEFNTNAVKTTLKSGENYSFTVNFAPTAEGNKTANVSIETNVGTKTISLVGNATPKPVAMFSITPSSKDFGDVEVNQTVEETFVITNTGNADLVIDRFTVTLANVNSYNPFPITSTLNFPITITPNATLDVKIAFKPQTVGNNAKTYRISTNIGTQKLSLTGNATAPAVAVFSINPASKDFGDVEVNKTVNQTFVITNTGNANLEITGYSITGTNANQFSVNSAPAAPFTIAANGTKNIPVVFNPTAIGNKTATLKFTTNIGEQTVSLTGNGTQPATATCATPVNIPDANFRNALLAHGAYGQVNGVNAIRGPGISKIDTNNDGIICTDEASAYKGRIKVTSQSISDLTGIEAFTNVTELFCNSNQLSSLNVSANTALKYLNCSENQSLSSLNVSGAKVLNRIYCFRNQLTSLNISTNTALQRLDCSYNQLTGLNVSANTALQRLDCINNQLTSLNVANGNNNNITFMYAAGNSNLTCIQHDTGFDPTTNTNWSKDSTANWSTNCQ